MHGHGSVALSDGTVKGGHWWEAHVSIVAIVFVKAFVRREPGHAHIHTRLAGDVAGVRLYKARFVEHAARQFNNVNTMMVSAHWHFTMLMSLRLALL